MKGVGAGDVKLLGAIGALKGPVFTLWTLGYGWILAGLFSLAVLIVKKRLPMAIKNIYNIFSHLAKAVRFPGYRVLSPDDDRTVRIPIGVAMCLGACLTWYLA